MCIYIYKENSNTKYIRTTIFKKKVNVKRIIKICNFTFITMIKI